MMTPSSTKADSVSVNLNLDDASVTTSLWSQRSLPLSFHDYFIANGYMITVYYLLYNTTFNYRISFQLFSLLYEFNVTKTSLI